MAGRKVLPLICALISIMPSCGHGDEAELGEVAAGGRAGGPGAGSGSIGGFGGTGGGATQAGGISGGGGTAGAQTGGAGGAGGALDGGAGSGDADAAPDSCVVGEVELCGGSCGNCDPFCASVSGAAGAGSGICGAGAVLDHWASCDVCREGDLCVRLESELGALACVEHAFCDWLLAQGSSACTFSDKTSFSETAIPDVDACPTLGSTGTKLCGGACGTCPDGLECSGRSPSRPIGLCLLFAPIFQVKKVDTCKGFACYDKAKSCFLYAGNGALKAEVEAHGLCLPSDDCIAIANGLPGGGVCVDGSGAVLGGAWQ